MSPEAILTRIRIEGEEQTKRILSESRQEAASIHEKGESEAKQIYEEAFRAAAVSLKPQESAAQEAAELEALRIKIDMLQRLVDLALDAVRAQVQQIRSDSRYASVLDALLAECFQKIDSLDAVEMCCLRADRRDRAVLEPILNKKGGAIAPHYDLNSWGGFIIEVNGGQIVYDNTLESRLEQATPFLRRYFYNYISSLDGEKNNGPLSWLGMNTATPGSGR